MAPFACGRYLSGQIRMLPWSELEELHHETRGIQQQLLAAVDKYVYAHPHAHPENKLQCTPLTERASALGALGAKSAMCGGGREGG